MWLDRFSGQSTPAGANSPNRAYSPAPRRQSHLAPAQRTGLGLTNNLSNASLDLSANTSTVSFSSPVKQPNGSALRHEQKPPPDVEDPAIVLRSVLGSLGRHGQDEKSNENIKIDIEGLDQDMDFNGFSLEEFANQTSLAKTSSASVGTTADTSRTQLDDFHNSISQSDQVLKSVEAYLTSFKAELGQVSAEIESLQQRSVQLNTRLENRRQVEKLLGPAVEHVSISPHTVRAIADGPIDEIFIKALTEVEARSTILESKKESSETVKALEDVGPLLDDLKSRAIERIRDFVVAQIKALRSPNINAQVIQQQKFVAYKDLFSFLARHNVLLAEEIGQAYINTMKWYYSSHFIRYQAAMEKLPIHVFDNYGLMGAELAPTKRPTVGVPKSTPPQHDAFGIGKRLDILKSQNDAAIPSYLAEDGRTSHYLEVPFRHFNQALIDNASAEYSVATEIFATSSYQQVTRKTLDILEPTFTLGHNLTKHLIETTTDCIGILICVRLNQHFAFELQRRKLPVMDNYINYTNILLWPRFQQVMDQHCESLKKVPIPTNRGAAAAAAFGLVGSDTSTSTSTSTSNAKASVAPHFITQRFGQLLHGILSLSTEGSDDEPLSRSLDRLRAEYEALMTKLAKGAAGDASKRARFLYNSYSLVLTIISDTQGKMADEQKDHFGTLLAESKAK